MRSILRLDPLETREIPSSLAIGVVKLAADTVSNSTTPVDSSGNPIPPGTSGTGTGSLPPPPPPPPSPGLPTS